MELKAKIRASFPAVLGWRRWFLRGARLDGDHTHQSNKPWYWVLWLTGVDYFSTLGYQPGIALLAAGALSPIATLFLIAITLLGALPIYKQVASRSYAGQGSIAMLEDLIKGWSGKLLVLILLGFASTDFIITMTLSAADAAIHIRENPFFKHELEGVWSQVLITLGLLAVLAGVFIRGFGEAIRVATVVAVPYLILNSIVLLRGLVEVLTHPSLLETWDQQLTARGSTTELLIASAFVFPRLALGMSGFETGVSVMPLVQGKTSDQNSPIPTGRIVATKRLLTAAALIMSVMLLLSSFVTTMLIPEAAYRENGEASGRAIAFLAHQFFGHGFGTVYDISTILILWFAGASAMAGMLNLIPRYLPRFGLAPAWAAYSRPLVLVLFAITAVVTLIFKADVEAQAGAYATGVLVLILSASVAVSLSLWKEASRVKSIYFWIISVVFALTLLENVIDRPDGVIIGSIFVGLIVLLSVASRAVRATELRVSEIRFVDDHSASLFEGLRGKKVNLVPSRGLTFEARERKAQEIKAYYRVDGPFAFVTINLLDNRSEFRSPLRVKVTAQGENYLIEVNRAIAIANSIAYVSELLDPRSIFLQLTRRNLVTQSFRFLLWGEGETGLLVYAILLRFWELTPEEDVRPLIFLMSD